ncbi:MAG: hypothetical protein RLZZ324_1161 [Candidatus Parcubacteria bacterium]|jgi:hypothetical protein
MSNRQFSIVPVAQTFVVTPEMIQPGQFWSAFGNTETEVSALWIVRYMQRQGKGWMPFTYAALDAFYRETRAASLTAQGRQTAAEQLGHYTFNELIDTRHERGGTMTQQGYVIASGDGTLRVTREFVMRCYLSSPADLPEGLPETFPVPAQKSKEGDSATEGA